MDVIYGLIPMMLIFGFLVVVVFIWMAKSGHFDDMDGQANRIFMDDEFPEDIQAKDKTQSESLNTQNDLDSEEQESSKSENAK